MKTLILVTLEADLSPVVFIQLHTVLVAQNKMGRSSPLPPSYHSLLPDLALLTLPHAARCMSMKKTGMSQH